MKLQAASSETVDATVLALARQDADLAEACASSFPTTPKGRPQGVNLVEFVAEDEAALEATAARASRPRWQRG